MDQSAASFTPGDLDLHERLRIYAIIRGDLQMTPGKLASQAAHAAKNCAILAAYSKPSLLRLYQGPKFLGTQIVLEAKHETALRIAHQAATEAGLIAALIIDEHHVMPPFFDGQPIVTALGIGPCTADQVQAITGRFKLVR